MTCHLSQRPRGRRIDQIVNPRDERGWKVPRPGTTRRAVYDGLVLGLSLRELADGLGLRYEAARSHKKSIVNWQNVNRWRRAAVADEERVA